MPETDQPGRNTHAQPAETTAPGESLRPLLVNAQTAADLLGVSSRLLWALKDSGDIPHVRVGKRGVRYDVDDLRAFIRRQKVAGR